MLEGSRAAETAATRPSYDQHAQSAGFARLIIQSFHSAAAGGLACAADGSTIAPPVAPSKRGGSHPLALRQLLATWRGTWQDFTHLIHTYIMYHVATLAPWRGTAAFASIELKALSGSAISGRFFLSST